MRVRRLSSTRKSLLVSIVAMLALLVQPVYMLVASAVASGPITTLAQLEAAAADTSVTVLSIKADITVTSKINFSGRTVYVHGNGHTLRFAGDAAGWQGNYIFQAYRSTMTLENLNFTGGDAAILANGATLNLEGSVDVSGNEFGGIEVSNAGAVFNVGSAALTNTTEVSFRPTVWIDQASTSDAVVNGPGLLTETIYPKRDQKQYYLNATNVLVDDVAPVFNIAEGSLWNTYNVEVVVTEDNIDKIFVDGIPVSYTGVGPSYTTIVRGEGTHTASAVDRAGNVVSVTFTIDTIAPSFTLGDITVTTVGNSVRVSGTTEPGLSVQAYADGVAVGSPALADDGGLFSLALYDFSAGRYTISVRASDTAGNEGVSDAKLAVVNPAEVQAPLPTGVAIPELPEQTGPTGAPARTSPAAAIQPAIVNERVQPDGEVLGMQTSREQVADEAVAQTVAALPTAEGWKLFGILWYWWLLAAATLAGLWALAAAAHRRRQVAKG